MLDVSGFDYASHFETGLDAPWRIRHRRARPHTPWHAPHTTTPSIHYPIPPLRGRPSPTPPPPTLGGGGCRILGPGSYIYISPCALFQHFPIFQTIFKSVYNVSRRLHEWLTTLKENIKLSYMFHRLYYYVLSSPCVNRILDLLLGC